MHTKPVKPIQSNTDRKPLSGRPYHMKIRNPVNGIPTVRVPINKARRRVIEWSKKHIPVYWVVPAINEERYRIGDESGSIDSIRLNKLNKLGQRIAVMRQTNKFYYFFMDGNEEGWMFVLKNVEVEEGKYKLGFEKIPQPLPHRYAWEDEKWSAYDYLDNVVKKYLDETSKHPHVLVDGLEDDYPETVTPRGYELEDAIIAEIYQQMLPRWKDELDPQIFIHYVNMSIESNRKGGFWIKGGVVVTASTKHYDRRNLP